MSSQHLQEKWEPILNHQDLPEIQDPYRRAVTAQLLENQERFLREQAAMGVSNGLLTENTPNMYSNPVDGPPTMNTNPAGQTYSGADGQVAPVNSLIGDPVAGFSGYADHRGPVAGFDPVLISLIRRSMPNLLAYDICGVQPMSGPTGMIFAMRSLYDGPMGPNEALFDEADPSFSSAVGLPTEAGTYTYTDDAGNTQQTLTGFDADGKPVYGDREVYVPYDHVPGKTWRSPDGSTGPGHSGNPGLLNTRDGLVYGAYPDLGNPGNNTYPDPAAGASGAYTGGNYDPILRDITNDPRVDLQGMSTHDLERAGMFDGTAGGPSDGDFRFRQMGFSIEKVVVEAKGRALKAQYSMEMAQDLRAIHGLDAEAELANILSSEILAEINREVIRTVYRTAKPGAQNNVNTAGIFDLDLDSNGRWSVEKFKGLLFQIERDCNAIAQLTRRGKGNFIICSADVASALTMAGVLDYTPALNANLNVDDTGNLFAGTINGKLKVYIDPYSANVSDTHYYVAGYKGTNAYDAGLFYCPYVPLQMVRSVTAETFQPNIGFKTRYGIVANPYAEGRLEENQGLGRLSDNTNRYYRRVRIDNLM